MRPLLQHSSSARSRDAAYLQRVGSFLEGVDRFHRRDIENSIYRTRVKPAFPDEPLDAFHRDSPVRLI